MIARVRHFLAIVGETFWLVPGAMVAVSVLGAFGLLRVDRLPLLQGALADSGWLYNGGATGARTLLGAIATATISVAGTVFSITIAALSLAAAQMGPRLLHNFVRDRGSQFTLGVFLGTFAYALMILRSVRSQSEGLFVPHLSLSVAIALSFLCVGTLVYFVAHMAGRINVDTVINLVGEDVRASLAKLTSDQEGPPRPPDDFWHDAAVVRDDRRGYLTQLDGEGLASWAAERGAAIRLLVRPGDFVFPGAPIALVKPPTEEVSEAIRTATALGGQRLSTVDLEFALRQHVEVAVRALSPGVNDPNTAINVLDHLGATLCDLSRLHLPTGVHMHDGRPALVVPTPQYDGLVDTMFHQVRQSARRSVSVLIRILEVLSAAVACEKRAERANVLERHAGLVLQDAERAELNASDLQDVRQRYTAFLRLRSEGARASTLV